MPDYRTHAERYNTLEKKLFYLLHTTKKRARKDNLPHDLDRDFIKQLFQRQQGKCYYTGIPFEVASTRHLCPSIDRLDYSKGYTQDNVVLASYWANRAKARATLDEFYELCWRVCENY